MKFSRNTLLLSTASFLVDISSEMIFPLLPFFLTTVLLAPVFVVGVMESMSEFTISIVAFVTGLYAERIGRRKSLIFSGYSFSVLFKGLLIVATSWPQVFAIRILERFGKGMRETPRDALIALSEPSRNLGRAYGLRKLLDNMGAIIGPLIASLIIALYFNSSHSAESYRFLFMVGVVPAFFAVILLFFLKDRRTEPEKRPVSSLRQMISHSAKIRRFLLITMLLSLGQFSVLFFLLRTNEYLSLYLVPIAYLIYNIAYAFLSFPAGALADRFGPKPVILAGYACFAIALAGFAFFPSLTFPGFLLIPSISVLFPLFILLGAFMAVVETVPQVLIVRAVPKRHCASVIGTYRAAAGILLLPANLVAGILWSITLLSAPALFIFSIFTTLVAFIFLLFFVKR